ncbi:MAG: transcription antitermination factor NusB [Balneola sp.]|mgnify:CR=1 FL=1|nr:transcription antitermination factor NusB [Balneola sp.]|tara:strand:+ start:793 stop:1242 length:450 start_codon:yes stop_codon:yes gene_type:complete
MIQRRFVRETVLQAIYAYLQSGEPISHIMNTLLNENLKEDAEALRFGERLFVLTLERKDDWDAIIKQHIKNWEISRLALIDKIILYISLSELINFPDIPTKVTINEAIDIAKKYSTAKSGRFVNGILDASLIQLQNEHKISKTGRGLIG